jgi:hypothetical protein
VKQRWKGTYIEAGKFVKETLARRKEQWIMGVTGGHKAETDPPGLSFVCADMSSNAVWSENNTNTI